MICFAKPILTDMLYIRSGYKITEVIVLPTPCGFSSSKQGGILVLLSPPSTLPLPKPYGPGLAPQ
jgi:hypothetical protein